MAEQRAGIKHAAAQTWCVCAAIRHQMHDAEALVCRQHLADTRQAIVTGGYGYDFTVW